MGSNSNVMTDSGSAIDVHQENTQSTKMEYVNTVLYLAQHLHLDTETCDSLLDGYNFHMNDLKAAEKLLRADLFKRSVDNVEASSKSKAKKTLIRDIFEMLDKANLEATPAFKYYPEFKDSNKIIDGATQTRKLSLIEATIVSLTETCKQLKVQLNEVKELGSNPTTRIRRSSLTVPNITVSAAGAPTYSSVTTSHQNRAVIQPPRKRQTSETRDNTSRRSSFSAITKSKRNVKAPPLASTGTGGAIKSWTACGPKKKVACKISFSKDISIEDLKDFCQNAERFQTVKEKLSYDNLGESKTSKNYRVVCSSWTVNQTNQFCDPTYWPTGVIVMPWKGAIKAISPRKTISKFLGNLDPTTTEEGLEKEIKRIYTNKSISNINVKVEKFEGTKKRQDLANFIAEISMKDSSTPQDILGDELDRSIFVRHWSGPLPSKRNASTTTQRKSFTATS